MPIDFDPCDLSNIYNNAYEYCLPRKTLDSWFKGIGFEGSTPDGYTEDEQKRLSEDIREIYANAVLADDEVVGPFGAQRKVCYVTAGAPGAGKTVLLEQIAAQRKEKLPYTDPDAVCLKQMSRTYQKDPNYDHWRPGSNAASTILLANFVRERRSFDFGTTATGAGTKFLFQFLKNQGYQIHLIHLTAPDHVRKASIEKRNETFVQVTEQDVRDKGTLLPQRINDTYLAFADKISFYYRDHVDGEARIAATWIRPEESTQKPLLFIEDAEDYRQVKEWHAEVVRELNRPDLDWEISIDHHAMIEPQEIIRDYFERFDQLKNANQWEEIVALGELAVKAAVKLGDHAEEAKIQAQLISTLFRMGQLDRALEYARAGQSAAEKAQDPKLLLRLAYLRSAVLRGLADRNNDAALFARAVEVARDALSQFQSAPPKNPWLLKGKILFNLGAALADNPSATQEELKEAEQYYRQAIEFFHGICSSAIPFPQKIEREAGVEYGRVSIRLGKVLLLLNKLDRCKNLIDTHREGTMIDERSAVHLDYLEAQYALKIEERERAIALLGSASAGAERLGAHSEVSRYQKMMRQLQSSQGTCSGPPTPQRAALANNFLP